jgi:hypothetical protein
MVTNFAEFKQAAVSGQNLAKAKRTPRRRAKEAALWLRGELRLTPTKALAADVFKVSVPLINEALASMNGAPAPTVFEQFVAEHQTEIWAALDRLTTS